MITSTQNSRVKWVRLLQAQSRARREAGAFVVEGVRLGEEALLSGWPAQLVFYTEGLNARGQALVDGFVQQGAQVEQVSPAVLRAASDTQAPQGLLVVLPTRSRPIPPRPDFLLIADAVRDPGNLGTMLRTAAAAGVEGFLLPPGAVDPFSPKVVRAGMGAHFRLPVHALEWEEIDQLLQRTALQVFLAAAGRGLAYTQADFRQPLALIVGGEAEGAGDQSRSLSGAQVHIPMPGGMESLNAAVAAAVLLFEVVRQRSST